MLRRFANSITGSYRPLPTADLLSSENEGHGSLPQFQPVLTRSIERWDCICIVWHPDTLSIHFVPIWSLCRGVPCFIELSPPKRNLFCLLSGPGGLPPSRMSSDLFCLRWVFTEAGASMSRLRLQSTTARTSHPSALQPESCAIFKLDGAKEYL